MQTIDSGWMLRCTEDCDWVPATVPGSVYTDLYRSGKIEDPYFKDNEIRVKPLMEKDYEYKTLFSFRKADYPHCSALILQFMGLDTVAEVSLNGTHLGSPCNMHRVWEYRVENLLQEGDNTLQVLFRSPMKYMAAAYQKYGNIGNDDTLEGFMHLRKAHYMSGWDWGACLPDAGIFRPVHLLGFRDVRLKSVYIRQRHSDQEVTLLPEPEIQWFSQPQPEKLSWKITVTDPDGNAREYENSPERISISNPRLWWPNGLGEQPLYTVKAELMLNGEIVDTWQKRIGLRTLTMDIHKDQWGESFAHRINGRDVFAMGADYIPEDHLLGRVSRERTYQLLNDCRLANFNSVRVWGGGYYPEDWFFDLCDEMGLLVWQDFMFACSVYELTPEFEENIREEFKDNIRRIRHHACLALWCGNNEMEMFVDQRNWVTKPSEVRDYILMYERIIPEMLKQYDPETFYWPASPSSGGSFDFPNDPTRGDVHNWDVWHGRQPFTYYREHFYRYLSEFGFQAFPSLKTLETVTDDPHDLNPYSYVMEKHQRNAGANGNISCYMQTFYRYPMNFSDYVYASQLLQGDGIRYGVEHYRRNRGQCMGAVYWQLNDCWPVISWSSIDYYGRWKALHYYAKRFFAPVMLSCEERGWMSEKANMNRQHFHFEKSIRLNVANETLQRRHITVFWEVRNAGAEILEQHRQDVDVEPLSSLWLEKTELPELDVFTQYVSYRAEENGCVLSDGTVIFSYPKYFRYEDPALRCTVNGDRITVKAGCYAKSVEILNENEDLLLSDNYFDMNGGEKTVKILRGKPEGLRLRSVYSI